MEELDREGVERLPYPLQRALVRHVGAAAEAAGRPDLVPMWAGQNVPASTPTSADEFLRTLVEDVSAARA
jgi:nitronate monooxygenase